MAIRMTQPFAPMLCTLGVLLIGCGAQSHQPLNQPAIHTLGVYSRASGWAPGLDSGIRGWTDGTDNSEADGGLNSRIVGWATEVVQYAPAPSLDPKWQDPNRALGPVTGDPLNVVSLGELDRNQLQRGDAPGQITLGFEPGIGNGPGPDFAVFENGFPSRGGVYGELAYVEVSSDGIHFARFASESLQPQPLDANTVLDSTSLYNLAGKQANNLDANQTLQSWGTPFDLETLSHHPYVLTGRLDLNAVRLVRLIDIPGNGSAADSLGNPIFDPWPTDKASGGFDLDAVGVLNPPPTASAFFPFGSRP